MVKQAQGAAAVRRVFGEPIRQDGVTVIPVARVAGAGGGGSGRQQGERPNEGIGGGFGLGAKPAGVYVIKKGKVHWRPALDVNRVIMGGQIVAIVALLTVRMIARLQLGRRGRGRRR